MSKTISFVQAKAIVNNKVQNIPIVFNVDTTVKLLVDDTTMSLAFNVPEGINNIVYMT